jgi:lysozyme
MDAKIRMALGSLVLSAGGLVGIALHEGYTDTAVQPLPGDKWTNGFGATEGVKPGDRTTPTKALARLQREVQLKYEGPVKQCVHVDLFQYEYDVFINHAYNVGVKAFCSSRMVEKLNDGDYAGACAEFDRWTFYHGKDCHIRLNGCYGLVVRRQEQRAACEGKAQ